MVRRAREFRMTLVEQRRAGAWRSAWGGEGSWPLKSVADIAPGVGLLVVVAVLTYGTGLRRARRNIEGLVRGRDLSTGDTRRQTRSHWTRA